MPVSTLFTSKVTAPHEGKGKIVPTWREPRDPSVTDERGATESTPYRLETTSQPGKSGTEMKQKPFYSLQ